jgi:hypothetical protein
MSLDGRLATLAELAERTPAPSFLSLLVEQNRRRLAAWEPDVVVPETFPPAALGAAVGAATLLGVVLILAPQIPPPAPASSGHAVGARLPAGSLRLGAGTGGGSADAEDAPLIARLSRAAEAEIRRHVWGEAWEHARETVSTERGDADAANGATGDVDQGWRIAGATSARRNLDAAGTEAAAGGPPAEGNAVVTTERGRDGDTGDAGGAQAASGAGTGSDPLLLGAPSEPPRGGTAFELPFAARVRALGRGPRPPDDDAPLPMTDEHPSLSPAIRRDAPVARAVVPPAYEPLVRRLFAHTDASVP